MDGTNGFEVIEVGKPYEPIIGMGEGVRFDLSPSGGLLLYSFDRPATDEIDQMKSGKGFEIRFAELGGIIWITSKCGNLEWADAPYNPRLSSGIPAPNLEDGQGIALTLVMVDARDGVVKSARLIGLGTKFSQCLLEKAVELRKQPMTMTEATGAINRIMMKYTSRQLSDMASGQARFRIK